MLGALNERLADAYRPRMYGASVAAFAFTPHATAVRTPAMRRHSAPTPSLLRTGISVSFSIPHRPKKVPPIFCN